MARRRRRKQSAVHAKVRRDAAKFYDEMLAGQGGHCALCPAVEGKRRLHIDHDHKTLVVRGILCFRCNSALRSYLTADWMRRAADYLDSSEAREAE